MATTRGERFLEAYRDIEHHLQLLVGDGEHRPFMKMVKQARAQSMLTDDQRQALEAYAHLRNAIVHTVYYESQPIADPVEGVTDDIERLRDALTHPPLALPLVRSQQSRVWTVHLGQSLHDVLHIVRENDFSQLPIYEDGRYVDLLTTNAIARWLAAEPNAPAGARPVTVAEVSDYVEVQDHAELVPASITATAILGRFTETAITGRQLRAAIITERGEVTDEPLGVVVAEDLPRLAAAVARPPASRDGTT